MREKLNQLLELRENKKEGIGRINEQERDAKLK